MNIRDKKWLKLPKGAPEAFGVVIGAVLVLSGSVVVFAANPALSFGPVLGLSASEPVSVVANMTFGSLVMAAGVVVAAPGLDGVLWTGNPEKDIEV